MDPITPIPQQEVDMKSKKGFVSIIQTSAMGIFHWIKVHPAPTLLLILAFYLYTAALSWLPALNPIPILSRPVVKTVIFEPTPTPTPLQGPGIYGCDPNGICNSYGDKERSSCPVTFADPGCLGRCADTKNHCSL